MFVCSKQNSCSLFSVASVGKMLGLERKGCTLYGAHFIQGPASAPQIFEAPFATKGGWCLICSGHCAACLEPGEADGSAGGTAEAWRFWIFPDLDLWSFPDLCRAGSTAQVLFGKENRLQLCSANMQTSTVKGGRIISADGS